MRKEQILKNPTRAGVTHPSSWGPPMASTLDEPTQRPDLTFVHVVPPSLAEMDPDWCDATGARLRATAQCFVVAICLAGLPVVGGIGAVALAVQLGYLAEQIAEPARRWLWAAAVLALVAGAANIAWLFDTDLIATMLPLAAGAGTVVFLCAMLDWVGDLGWQWPLERWRRATVLASSCILAVLVTAAISHLTGGWPTLAGSAASTVLAVATLWSMSGALNATESSLRQAAEHFRREPRPAAV